MGREITFGESTRQWNGAREEDSQDAQGDEREAQSAGEVDFES